MSTTLAISSPYYFTQHRSRLGKARPAIMFMTDDDVAIDVLEGFLDLDGLSWSVSGGVSYCVVRPNYVLEAEAHVLERFGQNRDAIEAAGIQGQAYWPDRTSEAEALATFGTTETVRWGPSSVSMVDISGSEGNLQYVYLKEVWVDGRDSFTEAARFAWCEGVIERLAVLQPVGAVTAWGTGEGQTPYSYPNSPSGVIFSACEDLEVLDTIVIDGAPNCSMARVGGRNVNFRGGYVSADELKRHETIGFFCGSQATWPSTAAHFGVNYNDSNKWAKAFNLIGWIGEKSDLRIGDQAAPGTTVNIDWSNIDPSRNKTTTPLTARRWWLFGQEYGTFHEAVCVNADNNAQTATLHVAEGMPAGIFSWYCWDDNDDWWTSDMVIEDMVIYGDPDSMPEASAITGYGADNVTIRGCVIWGMHNDRHIGVEFCKRVRIYGNQMTLSNQNTIETTFFGDDIWISNNISPYGQQLVVRIQHWGFPNRNVRIERSSRLTWQYHSATSLPSSGERSLAFTCFVNVDQQGKPITYGATTNVTRAAFNAAYPSQVAA